MTDSMTTKEESVKTKKDESMKYRMLLVSILVICIF